MNAILNCETNDNELNSIENDKDVVDFYNSSKEIISCRDVESPEIKEITPV